ncbi:hypothetical protein ACIQAC_40705 [Streptomyces sp. NPDC088387]|uniref:hypothetical protein n=1 Tax=Streptomyces sp. NPDC088387 TaxID=3365859 RepID=UPI0038041E48
MPSNSTFEADPDGIRQGGSNIDQLADIAKLLTGQWVDDSTQYPGNPTIGTAGDKSTLAIVNKYNEIHVPLKDAVEQIAGGFLGLSTLTTDTGKNFQFQQDENENGIRQQDKNTGRRP